MDYKILFVILDGVGDHVIRELGSRTPLEAAKKPIIDKLAKFGECGMHYPIDPGIIPGSDTGHLALFGYDPYKYYPGRGIFEALGANIELEEGDIAFRVNLGTVDENGIIIDRRSGRNGYKLKELVKEFNKEFSEINGVKIILKYTFEHRAVLVLRGKDLSEKVTDNDKHVTGIKPEKIKALDKEAKETAEIVNKLIEEFHKFAKEHDINKERKSKGLLPANYLLIRGASRYRKIDITFKEKWKLDPVFIAGGNMYKGVARWVGMEVPEVLGATGTINTSLFAKAEAALRYRDKKDIVFVHVKATDSLSHDKKPSEKKKFIEKIDRELLSRLWEEFDIVVITGDHTTSSIIGQHTADPVPLLIYSTIAQRKDSVKNFSERKCYKGILGFVKGLNIIPILLNKVGKGVSFGS